MVCVVTGGTGSFGSLFVERILALGWTARVFSRDELKQTELRSRLSGDVRFLLGDVRDKERLRWAFRGADCVVHAAALKRVDACEYDPFECVQTNVVGSGNVLGAAVDEGVKKAVLLSSDKAVHPVNTYGASKLLAEKLWLGGNVYGQPRSCFSVVRYGNIEGSRGSVFALEPGSRFVVRDPAASRFWMRQGQAVDLVLTALEGMVGGETFVPKLSSSSLAELFPDAPVGGGLEPGEKLHEQLISDEEVGRTFDAGSYFVIASGGVDGAERVPSGFRYVSGGSDG